LGKKPKKQEKRDPRLSALIRGETNSGMFTQMLRVVPRIPRGQVATYGDIAYAAGFPGAARQVAWALHASRGLPWQRVVGAGGKILLGGHAGITQRLKLEAEGVRFLGLRVDMKQHHCPYQTLAGKKTISPQRRRDRREAPKIKNQRSKSKT
jgi:methylated-DNA-protein-cysteine methyltransferase related protein